MGWQEPVALAIVALTAVAFVWSRRRPRKARWPREAPCGCAAGGEFSRQPAILFRARRGKRAEVVVRMN